MTDREPTETAPREVRGQSPANASEITIRDAHADDLPALTAIYNHYVLNTSVTFDLQAFNTAERRPWFRQFDGNRYRLLVAERAGQVIGYASSSRFRQKPAYDQTVETTIYLSHDQRGQGLGQQLYGALLTALARSDVHTAIAVITLPNDPSIALHERLGFREVGRLAAVGYKFGQYWDTAWLQWQA